MSRLTFGYLTITADPVDTITAAAAAGFRSVGIRVTGRRRADEYFRPVIGRPDTIREIRTRAADAGITISNVSAYHVYSDVTPDDLKSVVDTVAEIGSTMIVSNKYIADDGEFLDLFGSYVETAEKAGIRVAIEFTRFSQCYTIGHAVRLAETIGNPNVGLLVDPLHLDRCGGTNADVAAVPPGRILFAQLCDALKRTDNPPIEVLASEARTARLEPGKGEFDLYGFLDALPRGLEIEYEVPRGDHASLPLQRRAELAYEVFRGYMDGYAASRGFAYDWS